MFFSCFSSNLKPEITETHIVTIGFEMQQLVRMKRNMFLDKKVQNGKKIMNEWNMEILINVIFEGSVETMKGNQFRMIS